MGTNRTTPVSASASNSHTGNTGPPVGGKSPEKADTSESSSVMLVKTHPIVGVNGDQLSRPTYTGLPFIGLINTKSWKGLESLSSELSSSRVSRNDQIAQGIIAGTTKHKLTSRSQVPHKIALISPITGYLKSNLIVA